MSERAYELNHLLLCVGVLLALLWPMPAWALWAIYLLGWVEAAGMAIADLVLIVAVTSGVKPSREAVDRAVNVLLVRLYLLVGYAALGWVVLSFSHGTLLVIMFFCYLVLRARTGCSIG